MGFGLCALGYGFMLTYMAGGGAAAVSLLAYGFFLVSRFNKKFLAASAASLFMFPNSVIILFNMTGLITVDETGIIKLIFNSLFFLGWMSTAFFSFRAVAEIAAENGEEKLRSGANGRLYITELVLLCLFLLPAFEGFIGQDITIFLFITQIAVIIMNLLFMYKCHMLITTPKQFEEDKRLLKLEEEKLKEKYRDRKKK